MPLISKVSYKVSIFEGRTDEEEIDNYANPTFYMYKVYLRRLKF